MSQWQCSINSNDSSFQRIMCPCLVHKDDISWEAGRTDKLRNIKQICQIVGKK